MGRETTIRDAARVAGVGPAIFSRTHLLDETEQAPSPTWAIHHPRARAV
jgi:hypothetical protein